MQLPRIGKVRTKERTDRLVALLHERKARILSATISREADRRFVSLTCEVERPDPEPREVRGPEDVVGIDVGLDSFAVLSDGARIEAPKPLEKALRLLKRRSKQLSRKQKRAVGEVDPETGEERKRTVFSRNYEKAALGLARLHRRIRNIRWDFLHELTTEPAKAKPVIVVEDLTVSPFGVKSMTMRCGTAASPVSRKPGRGRKLKRGDGVLLIFIKFIEPAVLSQPLADEFAFIHHFPFQNVDFVSALGDIPSIFHFSSDHNIGVSLHPLAELPIPTLGCLV